METKEVKIQAPEGYEIDKENSTSEYVKFKLIKKDITYKEVCDSLFKGKGGFFTSSSGKINYNCTLGLGAMDKNNAKNEKQLERILALNQLLNIAEYYNRLHITNIQNTTIEYDGVNQKYYAGQISIKYLRGISAIFNRKEDAQAVIDNPNFREILDTIFK